MNVLTMVVYAMIAVAMAHGFFRGFRRTLLSALSLIMVIVTASVLSPMVNRVVGESVNVRAFLTEKSEEYTDQFFEGEFSWAGNAAGTDDDSISYGELIGGAAAALGVRDEVTAWIVKFLTGILSAIVTYAAACLIWGAAAFLLGRRYRGMRISFVDRILGMGLGFIRGLFIVWILLGFVSVLSFTKVGGTLLTQVEESPYLLILYRMNPAGAVLRAVLRGIIR